jgi:hypothetical protein
MKSFHIDCEIEYEVSQQTLFVFNLGVPTTPGQVVRAESVTSEPTVLIDEFADPGRINRFSGSDYGPIASVIWRPLILNSQIQTRLKSSFKAAREVLQYVLASGAAEADRLFKLPCANSRNSRRVSPRPGDREWIREYCL